MSKDLRNGLLNSKLSHWWHELTDKDRMALSILGLFLFAFIGIFGGMYLHNQANKQQVLFDKNVNEFFWLRAQSGNLKPINSQGSGGGNSQSSNSKIAIVQQTLSQAGIVNPTVAGSDKEIQISFQHTSQAVVDRVISQLQQQGVTFVRLKISQSQSGNTKTDNNTKTDSTMSMRVQATVN